MSDKTLAKKYLIELLVHKLAWHIAWIRIPDFTSPFFEWRPKNRHISDTVLVAAVRKPVCLLDGAKLRTTWQPDEDFSPLNNRKCRLFRIPLYHKTSLNFKYIEPSFSASKSMQTSNIDRMQRTKLIENQMTEKWPNNWKKIIVLFWT